MYRLSGEPDTILYTFKVWTIGQRAGCISIKEDLELYRADGDKSYGLTQGMPRWRGAVYGLFAAQDIPFTRMENPHYL